MARANCEPSSGPTCEVPDYKVFNTLHLGHLRPEQQHAQVQMLASIHEGWFNLRQRGSTPATRREHETLDPVRVPSATPVATPCTLTTKPFRAARFRPVLPKQTQLLDRRYSELTRGSDRRQAHQLVVDANWRRQQQRGLQLAAFMYQASQPPTCVSVVVASRRDQLCGVGVQELLPQLVELLLAHSRHLQQEKGRVPFAARPGVTMRSQSRSTQMTFHTTVYVCREASISILVANCIR